MSDFESWQNECKKIAVEQYGFLPDTRWSPDIYKEYFKDGYTPQAAMDEDMSYSGEGP